MNIQWDEGWSHALSVSFDEKERWDRVVSTEVLLAYARFFRWGWTKQLFNWSRKTPIEIERLMMLVIIGSRAWEYCFKREVGIGSRSQLVSGVGDRRLKTSSIVTGLYDWCKIKIGSRSLLDLQKNESAYSLWAWQLRCWRGMQCLPPLSSCMTYPVFDKL